MYAIVDIAGQQFKVEKDKKLFVHRLEGKAGSKVEFDQVLLIDNDKDVTIGAPVISGAMVTCKIIDHLKGDKVLVFKKKRRKGYQKLNGHRQYLTQIVVEDIIEKGAKPKEAEKKAPVEKKETESAAEKPQAKATEENKKPAASTAKKAEPKETVAKKPKTTAKKPAAKKPAASKASSDKSAPSKPTAKKTAGGSKSTTSAKKASPKKTAEKKDDKKEE